MSAHTPGDWYAEERDDRIVILAEGADYEIASLDLVDDGNPEHTERQGNADLIAAAPDLFSTLNAVSLAIDAALASGKPIDSKRLVALGVRADAAIAKARGGK